MTGNLANQFVVVKNSLDQDNYPFTVTAAPIEIKTHGNGFRVGQ